MHASVADYLDKHALADRHTHLQLGFLLTHNPDSLNVRSLVPSPEESEAALTAWATHNPFIEGLDATGREQVRAALLGRIDGEAPARDARFMCARLKQRQTDVGGTDDFATEASAYFERWKELEEKGLHFEGTAALRVSYERAMTAADIEMGLDAPVRSVATTFAGVALSVVADITSNGAGWVPLPGGGALPETTRRQLRTKSSSQCSKTWTEKHLRELDAAMHSRSGFADASARDIAGRAGDIAADCGGLVTEALDRLEVLDFGPIWGDWASRRSWDRGVEYGYALARKEVRCGPFLGHPNSPLRKILEKEGQAKAESVRGWMTAQGQVGEFTRDVEDRFNGDDRESWFGWFKRNLLG